jgi:predicted alpha/beta hydrolase family esterase
VKFFVAVPGQPTTSKILQTEQMKIESQTSASSPFGDILVVSGGDGYIDFRVQNTTTITTTDANEETIDSNRHMSYLIVWHLGST